MRAEDHGRRRVCRSLSNPNDAGNIHKNLAWIDPPLLPHRLNGSRDAQSGKYAGHRLRSDGTTEGRPGGISSTSIVITSYCELGSITDSGLVIGLACLPDSCRDTSSACGTADSIASHEAYVLGLSLDVSFGCYIALYKGPPLVPCRGRWVVRNSELSVCLHSGLYSELYCGPTPSPSEDTSSGVSQGFSLHPSEGS